MDQAAELRKLVKQRQGQASHSPPTRHIALKSIAITSGKGGVGKSNIALNLALALCLKGAKVLLIDADVGLANLDILLGIQVDYTLEDALQGRCSIHQVLTEGPYGLHVLPSRSGVATLGALEAAEQQHLFGQLSTLEETFDYLLIDTGAGVSPWVMGCNAAATHVLVVTTPEPTSLADSYALIKLLHQRNMPQHIDVIANQVRSTQEAKDVHQRLNAVSMEYLQRNIGLLGGVPYDEQLLKAVRNRQPLLVRTPKSLASIALQQLAAKLHASSHPPHTELSDIPPATSNPTSNSFWSRLRSLLQP